MREKGGPSQRKQVQQHQDTDGTENGRSTNTQPNPTAASNLAGSHHHLVRRSIRPAAGGAGRRRELPQDLSPPANGAFSRARLGDIAATSAAARGAQREQHQQQLPIAPATHGLAHACVRSSRSKGESSAPPSQSPRLDLTSRAGLPRPAMADRRQWRPRHLPARPRTHYLGAEELNSGAEASLWGRNCGDLDWIREGELGIGEFELYTRVVAGFGIAV
jgi:hypothetical protein